MVASVPEQVRRTFPTDGTQSRTASANSVSASVQAPKLVPPAAALITASITGGWACPRIMGPQEPTKSRYSRPSASVRTAPLAERMKTGEPPTEPKARTGEFTPPGMTLRARSKRA